ncbi:MAG TPA: hypothetical protein VK171_14420 [Fimbriimonas sp.]|nr:hypothetical protein [Fimbriimonas sp.]
MGSIIRKVLGRFGSQIQKPENWAVCTIWSDGRQVGTAIVRKDFQFRRRDYPWLVLVELPISGNVRTDEEDGIFNAIEEELSLIEQAGSMKLLASVGQSPTRMWILYAKTESVVANAVYEVVSSFGCTVQEFFDPKWERYAELGVCSHQHRPRPYC